MERIQLTVKLFRDTFHFTITNIITITIIITILISTLCFHCLVVGMTGLILLFTNSNPLTSCVQGQGSYSMMILFLLLLSVLLLP